MELRVLNYFLVVAQEENITKAARLLHLTQPTLSRQIMQLEEELGVKLFQRSNHNIELTDEGHLLKRRARELISLSEKVKRELSSSDSQLAGEIAIGCGELKCVEFIAQIIATFQKEHPMVKFALYSGDADSIKERIECGMIDIGLLTKPVNVDKYDYSDVPIKDKAGAIVHINSPLANKKFLTTKDLLNESIIISNRVSVQTSIANWFGDDYDKLNIVGKYNLMYNAAVMVKNKIGVVIGIELGCEYEDTVFVPLSPKLENEAVLVWKKNNRKIPLVCAFLTTAENCLEHILNGDK